MSVRQVIASDSAVLVLALGLFCGLASAASGDGLPLVLFEAKLDGSTDGIDAHGVVKPLSVEGKVAYAPGRTGQALICGGDGALVKYPVEGHLVPSQGTIEMWVKAVDWPADEQTFHIFFETEGPGWLVLYRHLWGGALFLSSDDRSRYTQAMWKKCTLLGDGQWHHIAGVWESQRLAFYVDGVLRKSVTSPLLPQSFAGYFAIGDAGWQKPHASHTLLQDVKIYRVALPDDQIVLAAQDKPLTYLPKVGIVIEPHPAAGQWKVMVDAGIPVGEKEHGAAATVEVLSDGRSVAGAKVENFKEGIGSVTLNISRVPVGAVVVKVRVLDAAGNEEASAELPFQKPADAPWIGNRVGMDDRVLAPFTAMRTTGGDVECWGRKYAMGAGPFPSQIESAGEPMLAEPVRVSVTTNQGEVSFQKLAGKVLSCTPTRAQIAGSAEAPEMELTTETTIEYDGMLWTEVTLTPKSPVVLTDVTIHIPVRSANAPYMHRASTPWDQNYAGFVPANGYETEVFQPFLWVGDNDRGLGWFAESQRSWSNGSAKPLHRIVRSGDAVDMETFIVNQPTMIKEPLRFGFGLQATPVKPRPADARNWRLGSHGVDEDYKKKDAGTIQIIWPNGHLAYFGYPWPADPEKFRALVADFHAKHIRVVPYINLNFLSAGAPESAYYGPEWNNHTQIVTSSEASDVGQMGHALLGACPRSAAWRDFIAWKIASFVDDFQVDGIYIDCWMEYKCMEEDHGCGWRDRNGVVQWTFPMRDYREILRRVQEIFQDRRPNPCLIIHNSASVIIPIASFADCMLDGEQYYQDRKLGKWTDDYLDIIPLDKWRVENTGRQWGVVPFFLPEFGPEPRWKLPTERMMGLLLAHDIAPWPIFCNSDVVFDAWRTLDKFGIVDASFLPYWTPNGVTTDNKDFIVSVYRKPGRALLVVVNTGKADGAVSVTADAQRLGLGTSLKARNAVDDSPLPISDQAVKLTVPARNYRMVVLE